MEESVRRRVAEIAARQFAHGDELYRMLDELEAHARRVEHVRFDQVLQEMRRARVVPSLHEVAQGIQANRSGRSLAHAEFWADSLDRWAEELIERDQPLAGPDAAQPAAGLPAAFVLDIMRVVAQEVDLREETRQADRARPGRQDAEHAARTAQLAEFQTVIAQRVKHVTDSLRTLPEGESRYFHEIAALTRAEQVMREARQYLAAGDAGIRTIAAETEAIELLHQTRRGNPKTGSGSGSAPGLGGAGGSAHAALASLDAGSADTAQGVPRSPQHATGTSGRRFPAEFRSGLDAFFDALDKALE